MQDDRTNSPNWSYVKRKLKDLPLFLSQTIETEFFKYLYGYATDDKKHDLSNLWII